MQIITHCSETNSTQFNKTLYNFYVVLHKGLVYIQFIGELSIMTPIE